MKGDPQVSPDLLTVSLRMCCHQRELKLQGFTMPQRCCVSLIRYRLGNEAHAIELGNFHTAFSEKLIVLNISTAFNSHFILKKEELYSQIPKFLK